MKELDNYNEQLSKIVYSDEEEVEDQSLPTMVEIESPSLKRPLDPEPSPADEVMTGDTEEVPKRKRSRST